MEKNKYFKDFFLFHEASLAEGLIRLDKNVGRYNYFAKMFMAHLEKLNNYRKLNKEVFKELKHKTKHEKSLSEINEQRSSVI